MTLHDWAFIAALVGVIVSACGFMRHRHYYGAPDGQPRPAPEGRMLEWRWLAWMMACGAAMCWLGAAR